MTRRRERRLAFIQGDIPKTIRLIPIQKFLAIRRPERAITVYIAVLGDASFLATICGRV
jgi:hypothetical protein